MTAAQETCARLEQSKGRRTKIPFDSSVLRFFIRLSFLLSFSSSPAVFLDPVRIPTIFSSLFPSLPISSSFLDSRKILRLEAQ